MSSYFLYAQEYLRVVNFIKKRNLASPSELHNLRKVAGTTIEEEARKEVTKFMVTRLWGVDQVSCDILFYEWLYGKSGSPVYFIEDMRLLNFIENARFTLKPELLVMPKEAITVAVPTRAGTLRGFLLTKIRTETHMNLMKEWFQWAGIYAEPHVDGRHREHFGISTMNPLDNSRLRGVVPVDEIENAIKPDWFENNTSEGSMFVPNSDDSRQLSRTLSIALRFLAYMSAFPELIKPGVPDGMKQRESKLFKGANNVVTIKTHPRVHASPEAHFRRFHFRHLHHRKFHRDENGNVRVVPVMPAIIGAKVDPYTAVAPKK